MHDAVKAGFCVLILIFLSSIICWVAGLKHEVVGWIILCSGYITLFYGVIMCQSRNEGLVPEQQS
jgi:formate hydrogenlyase subunit 3/multisubunit Na+/H+ antiporter MnhD subunit